ncbi:MAG: tRNA pseudouridine(55) synthase TruB [Candidatus Marinimicrobia bacterium]|nr:tRNA pseudouridine(55) synthase TruB [Candidatus Neomarinimicrobiota bacterium]
MKIESWNDRILNIYKTTGITSYDVVRKVKKITEFKKIGHGGTLDPFAEGVLLILIGKATKRMTEILKYSKSYEATLRLGESTPSGDNTSEVTKVLEVPDFTQLDLNKVGKRFLGEIKQVPPQYSAKKINGKPAYKFARKGIKVLLTPVFVHIDEIKLTFVNSYTIKIFTTCSSGTYIRVLGEDIARTLGTIGHLTSLKRTRIGNYSAENSIPLDKLSEFFCSC